MLSHSFNSPSGNLIDHDKDNNRSATQTFIQDVSPGIPKAAPRRDQDYRNPRLFGGSFKSLAPALSLATSEEGTRVEAVWVWHSSFCERQKADKIPSHESCDVLNIKEARDQLARKIHTVHDAIEMLKLKMLNTKLERLLISTSVMPFRPMQGIPYIGKISHLAS